MQSDNTWTGNHVICYRISEALDRFYLKLWEPKTQPNHLAESSEPYLYVANFSFKHLDAAEDCLRYHLLANGAADIPDTGFPVEGKVSILPSSALEEQDTLEAEYATSC